jgi:hypothetical protein
MTPATEWRCTDGVPRAPLPATLRRPGGDASDPTPMAQADAQAYAAMDDTAAWAVSHPVECGRHP